ncbi:MAG: hypothetical protein B7Z06_00640 [Flavobacteriales bacterium 32-35-8]|nr:MAG: hypothetical protein B7Z06_00640 [Flavobacteriales bacterium 32-35-8]
MKSFFTKIVTFLLAVMILFSTSSFTVDIHFCCNRLVDMSFLGKAKVCTEKVQKKRETTKQCTTLQEKDCCSNQTLVKTGDDTIKKAQTQLEYEDILFLNTFYYTYLNLFEGLKENIVPFKQYRPPLSSKDIQILYEIYLI